MTTPAKRQGARATSATPNDTTTSNEDERTVGEVTGAATPTSSTANPDGDMNKSTGNVGDVEFIDGQEHVLGDDPRRIKTQVEGGFHDSLSGRPVNENGHFTDTATVGSEGPVPPHRIVANNWPQERPKLDDPAKREGNTASE